MLAYITVVGAITFIVACVAVVYEVRDWVHANKRAILDEAERQRAIKEAVNQGWRERQAAILAPLDEALAHTNATLARIQLTTQERLDSTYSIIRKRKED
jgi:hypothetical protein